VRKLLNAMEDSQQQQQQQHESMGLEAGSSSSNDRWTARLYVMLTHLIGDTSLMSSTEAVQAAWRESAKPTAAMLEHLMHVQLGLTAGADALLTQSQHAETWQVVTSMLLVSIDDCVDEMGPLLRAALPAAPAHQAATETAADSAAAAAGAAETAMQCIVSADAATMASLFSMCISAVKLLAQQTRNCNPYATMVNRGQSPAAVLELIQQSAAIMICSSAVAGASQPPGSSEAAAAELAALPWAVLMLRCVQLGLAWAQDAAASLLSSNSGRGSSLAPQAAAAERCGHARLLYDEIMSPAVQQLTHVLLSLCQLEQGLQVLCWAFSRWVPAPRPHAATTKVALPQLQQCQQQLQ
jgi:hypothetical protein